MLKSVVLGKLLVLGLGCAIAGGSTPARADPFDDSFLNFAVDVHRTPRQDWPGGYGIYLGNGLFITAAHVSGRTWLTRPKIVYGGREYATSTVKEGAFEQTDVTVLAVDERQLPMKLRLRRVSLCTSAPIPGEDVFTVIPDGIVHSSVISPDKLPPDVRQKFPTAIVDVALTGNSGSGVFRATQRCLLGIMSRKISQSQQRFRMGKPEMRDIAKYFVPASEILDFLPKGLKL